MVTLVSKNSLASNQGQNEAMERIIAISRDTVGATNLYSSIVHTNPGGRTEIHHHGECETSIYILAGRARFYSGEDLRNIVHANQGDFVFVPAYEVHVEENASTEDELVVLLSRNCPGPVVHIVDGTMPDP